MKKFFIVILLIMLIICSVFYYSCTQNSYSGYEPEDSPTGKPLKISTRGLVSTVTVGEQTVSITVDSAKIATDSKEIILSDSTALQPHRIKLTNASVLLPKLLSKTLKTTEKNYVIYLNRYRIILWYSDIAVPIEFSREIVTATANGRELTPYYSFWFKLAAAEYLGTEPLITNEESHSRSYYRLSLEVYDGEYKIGTLNTKVSFYTANTPITFDATVSDYQTAAEVNI